MCRIERRISGIVKSDKEVKKMKNSMKIIGIVLLVLFALTVGVPLVLAGAGIALGLVGLVFGLAVLMIKLAVAVAIGYLILMGVRAMLR